MLDGQINLQKVLNNKLLEIKIKNPSFSNRAFAKKINLSPGALSGILNGKRRVSYKLASRLTEKLLLDPQERADILNLFSTQKELSNSSEKSIHSYLLIQADQFYLVSEWYHFAILSLIRTHNFKSNPLWISKRLGISKNLVKASLKRLLRAKLIQYDKTGNIVRLENNIRTTDDVSNVSILKAHSSDLILAQKALDETSINERDFTSITIPINPQRFSLAKEKIRHFQDELAALLEHGEKSEVYKCCIQLFPLTQIKGIKK